MERLRIENFAGISSMDIELNALNIFIGPQGSGKSVTVKLIYFFKTLPSELFSFLSKNSFFSTDERNPSKSFDDDQSTRFNRYFPEESWTNSDFYIEYVNGELKHTVQKQDENLTFNLGEIFSRALTLGTQTYKEEYSKVSIKFFDSKADSARIVAVRTLDGYLRKRYITFRTDVEHFIPANRSFFAQIQNGFFSLVRDNIQLDPFMVEFGRFYTSHIKQWFYEDSRLNPSGEFEKIATTILGSSHIRTDDNDFLLHTDGRKVGLSYASSGQQETFPLLVLLKFMVQAETIPQDEIYNYCLFIEEPEGHLFPSAQKQVVRLLSWVLNRTHKRFQLFITTHSPYILASFNNHIQAGKLAENHPEQEAAIEEVIPKEEQLSPSRVRAYSLENGEVSALMDEESRLISHSSLDEASNEISIEFGKLLDIEFQHEG